MHGISAFTRDPRELFLPFYPVGYMKFVTYKRAVTQPCWHRDLRSPASRATWNTFLCFTESRLVCDIVIWAAPGDGDRRWCWPCTQKRHGFFVLEADSPLNLRASLCRGPRCPHSLLSRSYVSWELAFYLQPSVLPRNPSPTYQFRNKYIFCPITWLWKKGFLCIRGCKGKAQP